MSSKRITIITWVLLIIMIITNIVSIYLTVQSNSNIPKQIDSSVQKKIESITQPKVINGKDGKDGYTPIKGIDYFDGVSGDQGAKGDTGSQGIKGDDGKPGIDGNDGKTPYLRCNNNKNRWEIRYSEDEKWQLLNGQTVACTVAQ